MEDNIYEIKILEYQIDEMLKNSTHFKNESVKNKKIFDVEMLRAKVVSKSEHNKAMEIGVLFIGVALSCLFTTIVQPDKTSSILTPLALFVFWIMILFMYRFLDSKYRKSAEINSYGVELINLLIEKKKVSNHKSA
ncbi:hypothetical protein ACFSMW_10590 [Virgibacillus halophilus]|uniref:Holin-X, holin superfamily III n=1 Tax=Tigheibacillus halophilus TaxID=361280 RepID=A0ABU5C807_9BACI|nr:hypothetical protein [Virgibacillus halophilus]